VPTQTAQNPAQFSPEKIKALFAALEAPFEPSEIRWRVTNTAKSGRGVRGQVMPYADQRAYIDRLNHLVGPIGWTRKYDIHTSAQFERSKDQKTTAKVIVGCEVTILGVASHAATGEEWADNDNAATSAEAQAFKRSCACLGLGRYLYYFRGTWVDLDERKQPKSLPRLPEWATPKGWLKGLRPEAQASTAETSEQQPSSQRAAKNGSPQVTETALIRQIESMETTLGKKAYRAILKDLGRAWSPRQIADVALQEKVLKHMQAAERGFKRIEAAVAKVGREPLEATLASLNVKTFEQITDLSTLHKLILALEAKADVNSARH
jgi:hypothetical protein